MVDYDGFCRRLRFRIFKKSTGEIGSKSSGNYLSFGSTEVGTIAEVRTSGKDGEVGVEENGEVAEVGGH
ncbi:hypothetical protein U1Q18_001126 [Sarracenia purpurea var. burkii]